LVEFDVWPNITFGDGNFTMIILYAIFLSLALSWEIIGPERGHVLDADIGNYDALVTTRVGVMKSSLDLTSWERDSRFPPDTKRVAVWDNGAWAAPPTQLWEIQEKNMRLVHTFPQSVVVDLDAQQDGTLFAGVRGKHKGVWRVPSDGYPQHVLTEVEPWVILSEGLNIWVGTINSGLWLSEEGQPFVQVCSGGITAIEKVGERIWISFPDGRLIDARRQTEIVRIDGGFVSKIAALGEGHAFLTIISPKRTAHPFQILQDGELKPITKLKVDKDGGLVGPTGAWSLGNGQALVGSFRRGPLLWDGELSLARNNFHATVSGGGAIDQWGRLVMAFMGTGVYKWQDGKVFPHPLEGPVTDSIAVKSILGQIAVIDFEGILLLEEDDSWLKVDGVPDQGKRIRNSLRDVAKTSKDIWWGLDHYGQLWQDAGEGWKLCALRQGIRFDGDGESLLIATKQGYSKPDCQETNIVFTPEGNIKESRAWGDWVAVSESLFFQNQKIYSLPEAKVDSMVQDGDGVLVSMRHEPLLRCLDTCEEVAPALQEVILSMGRLPDGRIWALEQKGTLLVDDGTENAPPAWYTFTENRVWYTSFMQLYGNPWLRGTSSPDIRFFRKPEIYIRPQIVIAIGVLLAFISGWFIRKKFQK
jgi:hypothetical protein